MSAGDDAPRSSAWTPLGEGRERRGRGHPLTPSRQSARTGPISTVPSHDKCGGLTPAANRSCFTPGLWVEVA